MNKNTALDSLPGFAAVLSIVACYGTLAFASILSLLGISINIHEGAWAGAITLFAWLAIVGVAINFRRYNTVGPLIIATAGAVLITWVMFMSFSRSLEILGFVLLITAAFWDRTVRRRQCALKAEVDK